MLVVTRVEEVRIDVVARVDVTGEGTEEPVGVVEPLPTLPISIVTMDIIKVH